MHPHSGPTTAAAAAAVFIFFFFSFAVRALASQRLIRAFIFMTFNNINITSYIEKWKYEIYNDNGMHFSKPRCRRVEFSDEFHLPRWQSHSPPCFRCHGRWCGWRQRWRGAKEEEDDERGAEENMRRQENEVLFKMSHWWLGWLHARTMAGTVWCSGITSFHVFTLFTVEISHLQCIFRQFFNFVWIHERIVESSVRENFSNVLNF